MMTGIRAVGLALAAAALLASCQGMPGAQGAQNQLPRIFELPSGLIAYIAEDGNVSVIDQTGGSKRALTSDATRHLEMSIVYLAPTAVLNVTDDWGAGRQSGSKIFHRSADARIGL